jgi:hypothetical protein
VTRAALPLPLLWMLACGGARAVPLIADAAPGADRSELALPDPEDSAAWSPPRWQCETKPDGRHFCQKDWPDHGLPPFGSGWLCHLAAHLAPPRWICHASAAVPTGTGTWTCRALDASTVRCEKFDVVDADRPPDPGTWVCVKGSVYGGTLCERVTDPNPPDLITGGPCVPGQRLWCDGLTYDAWGHVACDPATRRWKTITINGKSMLDCEDFAAGGKLPLTRCAQHHYFFSPLCCERTDCIVPDGTGGTTWPKSAGKLCDPCSPMMPGCSEAGAECIVTSSGEAFCGRLCSGSAPCPAGFNCVEVKYKEGGTKQCVPQDLSCYF